MIFVNNKKIDVISIFFFQKEGEIGNLIIKTKEKIEDPEKIYVSYKNFIANGFFKKEKIENFKYYSYFFVCGENKLIKDFLLNQEICFFSENVLDNKNFLPHIDKETFNITKSLLYDYDKKTIEKDKIISLNIFKKDYIFNNLKISIENQNAFEQKVFFKILKKNNFSENLEKNNWKILSQKEIDNFYILESIKKIPIIYTLKIENENWNEEKVIKKKQNVLQENFSNNIVKDLEMLAKNIIENRNSYEVILELNEFLNIDFIGLVINDLISIKLIKNEVYIENNKIKQKLTGKLLLEKEIIKTESLNIYEIDFQTKFPPEILEKEIKFLIKYKQKEFCNNKFSFEKVIGDNGLKINSFKIEKKRKKTKKTICFNMLICNTSFIEEQEKNIYILKNIMCFYQKKYITKRKKIIISTPKISFFFITFYNQVYLLQKQHKNFFYFYNVSNLEINEIQKILENYMEKINAIYKPILLEIIYNINKENVHVKINEFIKKTQEILLYI